MPTSCIYPPESNLDSHLEC